MDRQSHGDDQTIVEVYRDPVVDREARFGWRYQHVERCEPGDSITRLSRSTARIAVDDLLP